LVHQAFDPASSADSLYAAQPPLRASRLSMHETSEAHVAATWEELEVRWLAPACAVVLFTAADAALLNSDSPVSDLFFVAILATLGIAFGLVVGRWWALAALVVWVPIVLASPSETELSPSGLVVFIAGLLAGIQAVGVAVGVLAIRLKRRPAPAPTGPKS